MKFKIATLLSTITVSFLLFSCTTISSPDLNETQKIKSSDGIITLSAADDGLHIKKNHSKDFVHVSIHIKTEEIELASIVTDEKTNSFIYPFVEKDSVYSVYLTMDNSSWSNSKTSIPVEITATGGLGNAYISYSSCSYDNNSLSVILKDYNIKTPSVLQNELLSTYGNVFYDVIGNNKWSKAIWYKYSTILKENNLAIDISPAAPQFINKSFFVQLCSSFTYKGIKYEMGFVNNSDEKDYFYDTHPILNIASDKGTIVPLFNPKFHEYTLTGTDQTATISTQTLDGTNISMSSNTISTKGDSITITAVFNNKTSEYKITYGNNEQITFNDTKYIQTFQDNFDGSELDTSKWRTNNEERQPNMKNHGWWKDNCSYVQDGALVIDAKEQNGKWTSGAVDTQTLFNQSHGLYEIKFKCQKTSGLWYAFWLMGNNDREHIGNGATDEAEIDVFELIPNEQYNGPNLFKTSVHWDAYDTEHKSNGSNDYNPSNEFYDNWHTIQFIWGKENYELYLDGTQLWILDGDDFGGMCNGSNYLIISSEFGDWGGPINKKLLPAKMFVDYIKVYREY